MPRPAPPLPCQQRLGQRRLPSRPLTLHSLEQHTAKGHFSLQHLEQTAWWPRSELQSPSTPSLPPRAQPPGRAAELEVSLRKRLPHDGSSAPGMLSAGCWRPPLPPFLSQKNATSKQKAQETQCFGSLALGQTSSSRFPPESKNV